MDVEERIENRKRYFGMTAAWLILNDREFKSRITSVIEPGSRPISTHTVKLVGLVLATLCADSKGAYPAIKRLQELTGLSKRTVKHALNLLHQAGYYRIKQRRTNPIKEMTPAQQEQAQRFGIQDVTKLNHSNIYQPLFTRVDDALLEEIPTLNADFMQWARDIAPGEFGLAPVERLTLMALTTEKKMEYEEFDGTGEYEPEYSEYPGYAVVTMSKLAVLMCCHVDTVSKSLGELIRKHIIEVVEDWHERRYEFVGYNGKRYSDD